MILSCENEIDLSQIVILKMKIKRTHCSCGTVLFVILLVWSYGDYLRVVLTAPKVDNNDDVLCYKNGGKTMELKNS